MRKHDKADWNWLMALTALAERWRSDWNGMMQVLVAQMNDDDDSDDDCFGKLHNHPISKRNANTVIIACWLKPASSSLWQLACAYLLLVLKVYLFPSVLLLLSCMYSARACIRLSFGNKSSASYLNSFLFSLCPITSYSCTVVLTSRHHHHLFSVGKHLTGFTLTMSITWTKDTW